MIKYSSNMSTLLYPQRNRYQAGFQLLFQTKLQKPWKPLHRDFIGLSSVVVRDTSWGVQEQPGEF